MRTLSAKDAKYEFGRLIDLARAEPVAVTKHGRAVVVVIAVEEYERLKDIEVVKENNHSGKNSGTAR
ncbi:Antitoxin [Hyphomicrobiales bacterium]|nr:Antitoxin [Hyphomicrobiales bacterium]CAH1671180.1 Antitoxin [Hyphomicrobiales bacterium]